MTRREIKPAPETIWLERYPGFRRAIAYKEYEPNTLRFAVTFDEDPEALTRVVAEHYPDRASSLFIDQAKSHELSTANAQAAHVLRTSGKLELDPSDRQGTLFELFDNARQHNHALVILAFSPELTDEDYRQLLAHVNVNRDSLRQYGGICLMVFPSARFEANSQLMDYAPDLISGTVVWDQA